MTADDDNRATTRPDEGRRGRARSLWGDLSLRSKGLVVVGLPLLALIISALAFFASEREEGRAHSGVNRTLEVQAELQGVLTLVVDAETAVRGYVITRQDAFLEPFLAARDKLPAALTAWDRSCATSGPRLDDWVPCANRSTSDSQS